MNEGEAAAVAFLQDLVDIQNGTGKHEGHTLKQVGRCVYCSCGDRFQGRLSVKSLKKKTWSVVLADGFVSYVGNEAEAFSRAAKHEGATVRES